MAPPKLVTFSPFLYTLKQNEDAYFQPIQNIRRKLAHVNHLIFPNQSVVYDFCVDDLVFHEQLSAKVEVFIHKPTKTPIVIKYIKMPTAAYTYSHLVYKLKQVEMEMRKLRALGSEFLNLYSTIHLKNGQIPEEVLTKIAYSIIQALMVCETQKPKILARDIKPENILINSSGRNMLKINAVKICDFGTLRELEKACTYGVKPEDSAYWMPEMFYRPRMGYDERMDVWSLGITILEATKEFTKSEVSIKSNVFDVYPNGDLKINAIYDNVEIFLDQCFAFKYSSQMKTFVEDCLLPLRYRYRLKELLRKSMFSTYLPKEKHRRNEKNKEITYWAGVYSLYFILLLVKCVKYWIFVNFYSIWNFLMPDSCFSSKNTKKSFFDKIFTL